MKRVSFESMNCSLARSLEVFGEWWSLLIIREAMWGSSRFDEFQKRLGIARNILSVRLKHLEEHGIFERVQSEENARISDYKLTEKGRDLFTAVVAIMQWGDKWVHTNTDAPIIFIDRKEGKEIVPIRVQGPSGNHLSLSDIDIRPGPGAKRATIRRANDANRE